MNLKIIIISCSLCCVSTKINNILRRVSDCPNSVHHVRLNDLCIRRFWSLGQVLHNFRENSVQTKIFPYDWFLPRSKQLTNSYSLKCVKVLTNSFNWRSCASDNMVFECSHTTDWSGPVSINVFCSAPLPSCQNLFWNVGGRFVKCRPNRNHSTFALGKK